MNLVIVRHAQTNENANGTLQGNRRGSLSTLGKQQAKEAALLLKDDSFNAIYSSDLERCVDTTKRIIQYHPKTPVYYTSALREFNLGKLDKLRIKIPPSIARVSFWFMKHLKLRVPGGDSLKSLQTRMRNFLKEINDIYEDGTVLLVTHEVTMKAIRSVLDDQSIESLDATIPNCTIWRVQQ